MLTPTETTVLWGMHHPYWLIAIAIALLVCLQLAISMVNQLLRRSLKWLGKSPLFLGRWLITQNPLRSPSEDSQDQQLISLLAKLETLHQEQASLLRELQVTLRSRGINQGD
ncbi:hypothetical protein IQ260_16365 [Leptolyngbya cf. ectocarpi LEGE 11479]|uniref:Uncharacterized protein n=1 Tax=Leptolyngbya cf. ectocarpi LEGE 11479 TaxID=1828722 RepID=A0A929F7G2_LEPEC|nr:hypothetical protein [Leptolyngbya ectocarpi]MBE9068226.1 hypothetical protein [Leptolyngbya cf. ectocarpi LEGE 11479]